MTRSVHIVKSIQLLFIYDHTTEEIIVSLRLSSETVGRLLAECQEAKMGFAEAQKLFRRQGIEIPGFPFQVIEPDPVRV